jgi:ABC-type transport system involved in multi-copper enzyme maturation permease subunit
MRGFTLLFRRDFTNSIHRRLFLLLGFMVLFQAWFIAGSGSVEKVMETGRMNYMGIVFSFNILGSLAALAITFDSVSGERRSKVMDLLLTSGVKKRMVIAGKTASNLAVSFVFSAMYAAAIALLYLALGGGMRAALSCPGYIPAITAFNFIYCMLGLALSILFRSSRTSFIVCMAAGLLCMPRLLLSMLEGLAGALGLGAEFVKTAGMASPALIMNALGSPEEGLLWVGMGFLAFYICATILASMAVFSMQDELNYGE